MCMCMYLLLTAASAQPMTHYWDCCKPSCVWDKGQGAARTPLATACDSGSGSKLGPIGINKTSACDQSGNGAIMCPDQAPFFDNVTQRWLGFVAAQDTGSNSDCCDCYDVESADGKKMTVQVTNHGGVSGLFDLLVPGGGFGDFDGCSQIWPEATSVPQDRYGGLHSPSDCDKAFADNAVGLKFPQDIASCKWMFDYFPWPSPGVDYPGNLDITSHTKVNCPAALNERSGCWGAAPPPPPVPPPPPSPTPCPGGTLAACMALCPSSPPSTYQACVGECARDCPGGKE